MNTGFPRELFQGGGHATLASTLMTTIAFNVYFADGHQILCPMLYVLKMKYSFRSINSFRILSPYSAGLAGTPTSAILEPPSLDPDGVLGPSPISPSPLRCPLSRPRRPSGPVTALPSGRTRHMGLFGRAKNPTAIPLAAGRSLASVRISRAPPPPPARGRGQEVGGTLSRSPLSKTFFLLRSPHPQITFAFSFCLVVQPAFSFQRIGYRLLQKVGGAVDLKMFLFLLVKTRERTHRKDCSGSR